MSFWEHLDAMRGVMLKGAMLIAVLCVVLFVFMPTIFHCVLLAPCRADFPLYSLWSRLPTLPGGEGWGNLGEPISLVNLDLTAPLLLHFSAAFWLSLILALPMLLGLALAFVYPGLYKHERKMARIGAVGVSTMFYIGVAAGYMVVFPLTLRFLHGYQADIDVPNTISITSYMHTLMTLCVGMGLLFELPLVAWLLGRCGLLEREFFHRFRRHAIVAIIIVAAIITPTSDPFTLMVVFTPTYMLWEAGAWLVPKSQPKPVADEQNI